MTEQDILKLRVIINDDHSAIQHHVECSRHVNGLKPWSQEQFNDWLDKAEKLVSAYFAYDEFLREDWEDQ